MDGENDFRKSTVLQLVVFAIEPPPPLMKYAHVFWPGMVGTASGLNEAGVRSHKMFSRLQLLFSFSLITGARHG
jgi:hypothetical protein